MLNNVRKALGQFRKETGYRLALIVFVSLAGFGLGWHSVSAVGTAAWQKSNDKIFFTLNGVSSYWALRPVCCSSSQYSDCMVIDDTGSAPHSMVVSSDYTDFYNRCSARPYYRVYFDAVSGGPGQFTNGGLQTWPADDTTTAPARYQWDTPDVVVVAGISIIITIGILIAFVL